MEHLVPEQMFSTDTDKAQGISAVKALAIASQQGQKIWTINKSNLELALSKINLGADAEADIRNGVNAGKIVTAHEARINFNGWIGEGYTLIDPNTGAGGYIISGGGNGSFVDGLSNGIDQLLTLFSLKYWKAGIVGFLKSAFEAIYNCSYSVAYLFQGGHPYIALLLFSLLALSLFVLMIFNIYMIVIALEIATLLAGMMTFLASYIVNYVYFAGTSSCEDFNESVTGK